MERNQLDGRGRWSGGTHRYPGWQLVASFSAGSKWVTMDQHPLKFKLDKDSRQTVNSGSFGGQKRSFKREVAW